MNTLTSTINTFYRKYYSINNFIYLFDFFLNEYIKFNDLKLSNDDKIKAISNSEIKYNKKLFNILLELYKPINEIKKQEEIIKQFIEFKFVKGKTLEEFKNNDINDYLLKILKKIDKQEFTDDIFYPIIEHHKSLTDIITNLQIREKINPTIINRIIDEENFYSYLCYYKATINFFLTNKIFLKQYMIFDDDITTSDSPIRDDIVKDIYDIIEHKEKQIGGNVSFNFFKVITTSNNIKDIKLFLDNIIPKYKFTEPGIIHYPSYLINNIIYYLDDNLTNNCEFFDLSINNFNYDLNKFRIDVNRKKLKNLNLEPKDIHCNYFINRFKELNKTKKNILIHCPINCLADYYVFDNFRKNKLTFDQLYILSKNIKAVNKTNIIYPFTIDNYYLDSFIICINKGTLDCHFSFIKRINDKFKLLDSFNHEMIIKEIIKNDCVIDNISYRIVFVSYMKK